MTNAKTNYSYSFDGAALYKRGYLKRRDNGTWKGTLTYLDEQGKRRQKTSTFPRGGLRETAAQFKAWQARLDKEYADSISAAAAEGEEAPPTLADCLDLEIAARAAGGVERSTLSEYRRLAHRLITPHIGSVPVAELSEQHLNSWLGELQQEGYADTTIKKALVFLKGTLSSAVRMGYCEKNIAADRKYKQSKPVVESNALDEHNLGIVFAVLRAALDTEDPSPFYLGVMLALYTGMREAEICALRWRNVDIEGRYIHVREAVGRESESSTYYLKAPKSAKSRRSIYFGDDWLAETLAARKAATQRACADGGFGFGDGFFVVGYPDGGFMTPARLSHTWKRFAETLQLKGTLGRRPTFHDLRHTYATISIANGADVKTVSEQMGHADASITLNRYASALGSAKQKAAAIVGSAYAAVQPATEAGEDSGGSVR